MNVAAVTMLVILQLSSVRGARMPHDTLLGVRLDMLRREAQLVLGRKQAILELATEERSPAATTSAATSGSALAQTPFTAGNEMITGAGYSISSLGDRATQLPRASLAGRPSNPRPAAQAAFLTRFLFQLPPPLLVR